ncbi:GNAT family N-acetyltransferase [Magnetospirillum fulvum]|uniref:Acetyltransferase (GNAT) family protein n=1 Tax=Magnetospirillum fulvum TaxID=1082 RepID=A0A1H6HI84_MAGFU|nr:GNAT family N-acetyltransferase [Magnetospirillum fulvum]SEH33810.1 Acetyltransferase (GNAT) family protein [Magnetospirillum fulvum]
MNISVITVDLTSEADLEAVVALDSLISGQSRRGFYIKKFAAARRSPETFVFLRASVTDRVDGYLLVRIVDGEFGATRPAAVIEAIGTNPALRGKGIAHAMMAELETRLAARGVREIHSEAEWTENDLIRFFASSGFHLAPHQILGRAVTTEL